MGDVEGKAMTHLDEMIALSCTCDKCAYWIPDSYNKKDTGKFNGHIITHPERLDIPLKRKKPTVYAVWNDLFHEAVPDQLIYGATRVMKARSMTASLLNRRDRTRGA